MATPVVSVLLPYRDAAATIEEAIDSTLAGVDLPVELLALDDGSRDEGPARVARLAARHAGLVAVAAAGRSQGIARTLARGLALARGGFIARMDGDDVSREGRLARQLAALRAEPSIAALGTRVLPFPSDAVGEGLSRYVAWQNGLVTPEDHARELFVEAPLCHPSVMMRREPLLEVGGYRDTGGPEDYDLWLRLDAAGYRMAKLPEVLLGWRRHGAQSTFTDPRYGLDRLREAKAPFLARRLFALRRPVIVWGAGPTGRRLLRALESHGVRAERFIDIDPARIGRRARDLPIAAPASLVRGTHTIAVAVGARGARDEIRAFLSPRGFVEGEDFLFAA